MLTQKMGRKTTGAENKVMARKGKKTNALRLGDSMAAGNRYIWNEGAENISACDNTQHIWNCPNVIQREVVRFKPDVLGRKRSLPKKQTNWIEYCRKRIGNFWRIILTMRQKIILKLTLSGKEIMKTRFRIRIHPRRQGM